MIKPFVAVAIAVVTLTGCANNNTLSGDVFTASQAKQVQTVSYGTLISVRPVTIQGGDDNNVVGAIGGAVLGDMPLVKIGEDAHKGPVINAQQKKTLVILVVGETARSENFSLGGYARETNPRLQQQDIIYFKHASSCGTETAVSVP